MNVAHEHVNNRIKLVLDKLKKHKIIDGWEGEFQEDACAPTSTSKFVVGFGQVGYEFKIIHEYGNYNISDLMTDLDLLKIQSLVES